MNGPGTPSWLRARNDRTAFRLLLEHGTLSRAQLAKVSGMSKPTAGLMITRLEQLDLIMPADESVQARNPNATAYQVRPDARLGVAISIQVDQISAMVVDPVDTDYPVVTLPTAKLQRSPGQDTKAAVVASCQAAGVATDTICEVVIGVQAAVDAERDHIHYINTLPGWPPDGSIGQIRAETGWLVTVENDVNLAALSEKATGLDVPDFIYVWLGTGLGLGFCSGNEIHRGIRGDAGEIGYLEIPWSAKQLDPDAANFDHLLGGPALIKLLGGDPDRGLLAALEHLAERPEAVARIAARVAPLVNLLAMVLDPAAIVLGGPTGHAGGPELAALVAQAVPGVRVETSKAYDPKDDPVLDGARRMLVTNHQLHLEEIITAS